MWLDRMLAFGHGLEVLIDPIRPQAEILPRQARALRVSGESAGDQLPVIVEPCGDAMDSTDEGAATTTDHAQSEATLDWLTHAASVPYPLR